MRRSLGAFTIVASLIWSITSVEAQSVLHLEPGTPDRVRFGEGVAVTADVLAVGGVGFVRIHDRTTGAFLREVTQTSSPPGGFSYFGFSLAPLGADILVGDPVDDDGVGIGSVERIDPSTGALVRTYHSVRRTCSNCEENFGTAVAAVGGNVLIAAADDDTPAGLNTGAVYLVDAGTGTVLRTFTSPHPTSAPLSTGNFGVSVAAAGADVLVGAPYDLPAAGVRGAAYLFDAATGDLLREFQNPSASPIGTFGAAVAAFGTTIVVGAPSEPTLGAVYLFDAGTGTLLHTLVPPSSATCVYPFDCLGKAIATFGTEVLVGDPFGMPRGVAFLFDGTTGVLERTLRNPVPTTNDGFGFAVARADGTIVVGSPFDEGPARSDTGVAEVFYGGATGCGPCEAPGPLGGCASTPNPTCRPAAGAGKASLTITNATRDSRDRVAWKWKGRATTIGDFAPPLAGDDVALCVWDESGATPALLFRALAPSDAGCAGSSCWHGAPAVDTVSYKSATRSPDGIERIRLVASGPGPLAHMLLTGAGTALSARPFGLPVLPPPLPLRVQL